MSVRTQCEQRLARELGISELEAARQYPEYVTTMVYMVCRGTPVSAAAELMAASL